MNNKGLLTLDFLFSMILVLGLTAILFALSFSLSVFEVVQYMAFSASKSYNSAHLDIESQKLAAQNKFNELKSSNALRSLFKSSWFQLGFSIVDRDNPTYASSFSEEINTKATIVGVVIEIKAPFLDLKIPFYGSTTGNPDGFKTRVNSFLGREPTDKECHGFVSQRWNGIKAAIPQAAQAPTSDADYIIMGDNGC